MEGIVPEELPYNMESEQALLGSIFVADGVLEKVVPLVRPEDFFIQRHRIIYEGVLSLYEKEKPIDATHIQEYLSSHNVLETIGGSEYLATLWNGVVDGDAAEDYAIIVRKYSVLRDLVFRGNKIALIGKDPSREVDQAIAEAEQLIYEVSGRRITKDFRSIDEPVAEVFNEISSLYGKEIKITGIPSGFEGLDNFTQGFQRSTLNIIAGRPGTGKSAWAFNLALSLALQGRPVGVFSIEMSLREVIFRLISSHAEIDSIRLKRAELSQEQFKRLLDTCTKISTLPIYFDDTPTLSLPEMRAKARRMKSEKGVQAVIVDYLQIMTTVGDKFNRVNEVSAIARGLKSLARELDIPVVALAQLNRDVEKRGDKTPQLSDLRECISGDAVVVDGINGRNILVQDLRPGDVILSRNSNERVIPVLVEDVWPTGVKPAYRVKTKTGKKVKATANHPFLTTKGWKKVGELLAGDIVATAILFLPMWEEVVSVEYCGEEETFDLSVPETGCFIANGIVVHNSGQIEQEADIVIFLSEDEEHNDSTDPNVPLFVNFSIAKHRAGPTGNVPLIFDQQYTRFRDAKLADYKPKD